MSKRLPFGWHRTRPWLALWGEDAQAHKTVRLSNGQYFRFTIYVDEYDATDYSLVTCSIVAYSGKWVEEVHSKEGTATGPGGAEVLEIGLELLRQSEIVALALAKRQEVIYEVSAASPALFRIYSRYLSPRGYVRPEPIIYDYQCECKGCKDAEPDQYWEEVLRKTLREETR